MKKLSLFSSVERRALDRENEDLHPERTSPEVSISLSVYLSQKTESEFVACSLMFVLLSAQMRVFWVSV